MKQRLIDANKIIELFSPFVSGDKTVEYQPRQLKVDDIKDAPTVDAIPVVWMENELEVLKDTVIHIPNFKPDYWLLNDEIKSLETVLGMWREEKCGADGW